MAKAALLDRDGTLIEDVPYLGDPAKVVLGQRVVPALRALHAAGYLLVVVTNQSGIGRGYITESDFAAVQARLAELLAAQGVPLRAVYHCPHHPTAARGAYLWDCPCRKPKAGMLEAAIADLALERDRTWMIGDTLSDVEAGCRAGVRTVLLRNGIAPGAALPAGSLRPDCIAADLLEAVERGVLAGAGQQ